MYVVLYEFHMFIWKKEYVDVCIFFLESRPDYWAGQVKVGVVNSGSIQERISYYRANAGQANVGRESIAGESINEQGRKKKNDSHKSTCKY